MKLSTVFTKVAIAFTKAPSRRNDKEEFMTDAGLCWAINGPHNHGLTVEQQIDGAEIIKEKLKPTGWDPLVETFWLPTRIHRKTWVRKFDLMRARVAREIAADLRAKGL